jgi:formylglycine-generating enzyme required for sulfatase activity
VQVELVRLGYDLSTTQGEMDGGTGEAIRDFEDRAGQLVKGEASESLLALLKSSRKLPPPSAGTVFSDALSSGGRGPDLVVLPKGSFQMGSNSGGTNEKPVRRVSIDYPLAMMTHEVTWDDWEACVRGGGCDGSGPASAGGDAGFGKDRRPVINMDWNDAKAYAEWLSGQTGKRYRLPSESEWEYAARAGTTTEYSWGDSISCSQACYGREIGGECTDSPKGTVPVKSFSANAFGLYDMHGNVSEWVEDCYQSSYSGAPSDGSARTRCDTPFGVQRGGGWYSYPRRLRSAYRSWVAPSSRSKSHGFRLVQDLGP